MNRKTPTVYSLGFSPSMDMQCAKCKEIIPRFRLHKIGVYYERYYDFCGHYHLTCKIPDDTKTLTGKP